MRKTRFAVTLAGCLLAVGVLAWAQMGRKAGLWEVTSTTTFQQSPFPAGMTPPPGSPFGGGPRTTQVCVTQAQVDKYNGLPPQKRGDCQVTDLTKTADGFTASIACTGRMASKGTVEAHYTGDGHGTTKIHLLGDMQGKPVEMTTVAESTFKGPDCGSVKPFSDN